MITVATWENLDDIAKQSIIRDYYIDAEIGIEGRNILLKSINVIDEFIALAMPVIAMNERIGARCLVENIRYKTLVSDSDPMFKINNNLSKFLARITMAIFPEFNGFFEKRRLK